MERLRPTLCRARILRNERVAPDVYWLVLALEPDFPEPSPGQFVLLRVQDAWEPFLPRPMSVFGFERTGAQAVLEVLYRVVGRGTAVLASRAAGDVMDLTGPLGRGFDPGAGLPRILVGGGMGVAPLVFLAAARRAADVLALGCRSASEFPVDFVRERVPVSIRVSSEDGSSGVTGLASELAEALAAQWDWKVEMAAAGPPAMLASVARLCRARGIRCQVTVEARMACGVGSCQGCAIPVHGAERYRRACKDGPVFEAADIRWEALT